MAESGSPMRLSAGDLDWPAGTRARFVATKARCLQARRGRRARLAVNVVTVVGSHEAIITRVSLHGACIGGGRRLKRREIVALRLPSGWRIKARVQWRFGSRCWISFMTPVADFARILCEGGAVNSRRKRRPAPISSSDCSTPNQRASAPSVAPSLTDVVASLTAWAIAFADRIRAWASPTNDRRDPRSG